MAYEPNSNKQARNEMQENRRAANSAVWIPVGTGAGVALGLALGNLALGITIGAGIGVVIGIAMSVSRMGAEMETAETPGRRWIYVIAAIGGVAVLVGMIILFELIAR
ncbi:MAG: hypothetical protein JW929_05360 [Anaerolineales bacterium]|nr:hypothetical protein [Anaerolineales bacterium]